MIKRREEDVTKKTLEKLIKNLQKVKMKIEARRSLIENQIKNYLRKGRNPPPGLLISWRNANMLATALDSIVASMDSSLMLLEVREGIQEALGEKVKTKELMGVFNQLIKTLQDINLSQHQLARIHQRMLEIVQGVSQSLEDVMAEMAGTSQEIIPETSSDLLKEFIKAQGPDFIKSLPEDIRRQLEEEG